jgi:hypothetical protein
LIGVVLIVAGCWHGTTGGATEGGQTSDPAMHTEQTAL